MLFKLTMLLGVLSFSLVSCTQPTPNAVTVEVTREVTRQTIVTRVVPITATLPPSPPPVPAPTTAMQPPTQIPTPLPASASVTPYARGWLPISTMSISRGFHSGTVLRDGRVLIIGGYISQDTDTASVEIFDPATNTFRANGSLNIPRHGHTATLLPDGRVLIVGGYNMTWLNSAELYDPATGQSTNTQPLFKHGTSHTATLLKDGRVLVIAGAIQSGFSAPDDRVEIFDPRTNRWQQAAVHENAQFAHTATLLNDGRVLLAGGFSAPAIYDPARDAWEPTGELAVEQYSAQAVRLRDGKVLLIGGQVGQEGTPTQEVQVYDPASNTWSEALPLSHARYAHTATLMADGRVLVLGGWDTLGGYENSLINTAEIYDRSGNWTPYTAVGIGRVQHIAALLADGRILVTGGETKRGSFLSSAGVLKP